MKKLNLLLICSIISIIFGIIYYKITTISGDYFGLLVGPAFIIFGFIALIVWLLEFKK